MLMREKALDESKVGDELEVTSAMERWLIEGDYDLHFIHIDLPDHAGHATDFNAENPEYIEAIEKSDELSGRLLDAIEKRASRNEEKWLVALVTDHGGNDSGHGARDAANQTVYFVVAGEGIQAGELPESVSQVDLHPTVMRFLGVELDPSWKLDGQARGLE